MTSEEQTPVQKPVSCRMIRLLLLLFAFLCWQGLSGQPNINAALEKTEILIGDQVMLTISVNYQPPVEIENVDFGLLREVPELEVLRAERFEKDGEGGQKLLEVQLNLTSFDSGYYRIPPIPITYREGGQQSAVRTNELALKVNTLPLEEDEQGLQPIKSIMEERINFRDVLPYLLIAALLIALALFIYYRTRPRPAPAPAKPPRIVPAHVLALEQLQKLEEQKLWQQGRPKDYHSELTHIVRTYLERRYRISAMDKTTTEILGQLGSVQLDKAQEEQLRVLLQKADLVKFAKAEPPATFHQEAMAQVRHFVQHTRQEEITVELSNEENNSQ